MCILACRRCCVTAIFTRRMLIRYSFVLHLAIPYRIVSARRTLYRSIGTASCSTALTIAFGHGHANRLAEKASTSSTSTKWPGPKRRRRRRQWRRRQRHQSHGPARSIRAGLRRARHDPLWPASGPAEPSGAPSANLPEHRHRRLGAPLHRPVRQRSDGALAGAAAAEQALAVAGQGLYVRLR